MATGTPAHELRELNNEELTTRLREAKEELFNLRFQAATGQLTNNRRLGCLLYTSPSPRDRG